MNPSGGEGAEVVYALRDNSTLAGLIFDNIEKSGQVGYKYYQRRLPENPIQDYYFIHRDTKNLQPILIEYGYLDNENDAERINDNLLNYVEGVVEAVANYTNTPYQPLNSTNGQYYTVEKGDSLWNIAKRFGVLIQDLIDINNLANIDLQIGQQLLIPSDATPTIYTVQKGDSLWNIAKRYNTTVDKIKELNNLESNNLSINQQLQIPN